MVETKFYPKQSKICLFIVLNIILIYQFSNAQSIRPYILNNGGKSFLNSTYKLDWNLGESISIQSYKDVKLKIQSGLLQIVANNNIGNDNSKYDIGFVLQGYDSSRMFTDTSSFSPYAQEITRLISELSFGKVSNYKIYMGGVDSRNPIVLTSELHALTLQASLDGWPDKRWDWLRSMTGFWYTVPLNYRTIISNAISWINTNKKTFFDWQNSTEEGRIYGNDINNNVVRMGPDASELYLGGTRLPENYEPFNHKVTLLVFNTFKNDRFGSAAANTLYGLGVKRHNGDTIPPYHNSKKIQGAYLSIDSFNLKNQKFYYTVVHEMVHAYGVGTHDINPNEINKAYGVLSSWGAIESIHTLPAWDRYFWTGWLSKNTITTNPSEIADLKGKFLLSDTSRKYILQIVAGDARGCGGTYKELFDGKWYTYTVDNWGTLTYTEGIDNTNFGAPIIEIQPFSRKVNPREKTSINVHVSGIEVSYEWKKNGIVIPGSNTSYLSFNEVLAKDTGLYQVTITNSKGSVVSNIVKLSMICPSVSAPIINTINNKNNLCFGDSIMIQSNYTSLNAWYKNGILISNTSEKLIIKDSGTYTNAYIQENGCATLSNSIHIDISNPIIPLLYRDSANNLVSSSLHNIWYKDGVQIIDTSKYIKPLISGFYSSKSNLNGCLSALSSPYYYIITDIIQISNAQYIKVTPNPFTDNLNLDFSIRGYKLLNIDVVNIATGVTVFKKANQPSKSVYNLNYLPSGTYAIKVFSDDRKVDYSFKTIKL